MAKFKQIPQNFMFRKLLKYWGNMVCNYDDDCRDDEFFAVGKVSFPRRQFRRRTLRPS